MEILVDEFKKQFPRFTPEYLPVYQQGKTYFKDEIVYFGELFYKCIVENTINPPNISEDWKLINQSVLNYTQDTDIENAIKEASINFNEDLFDKEDVKMIFCYLVAFYLTLDFDIALGTASSGIITSKSVGSVSESYNIPQWILNDSTLGIYAKNGYGLKYLTLIKPYIIGGLLFFKGATTID